ncbi:MAG TPA: TRAP transporter small permease subunit [Casimicrobiaceae bacterium]|nr:TRAP transporter small permease subunit [Casimicrobiaceae bacterium]
MLKKLYERVIAAEAYLAAAFLVLMVALIFLGGVSRVLGYPLNWSVDFATAFFAWACFLCADIAWRKNSLMAIEILTGRLPSKWQTALRMLNYFLIGLFLLYAMTFGTWLAWTSRVRSFQGIPEISYSWVTMSMPIGAALLLMTTILKVRDEMRGMRSANVGVDVI